MTTLDCRTLFDLTGRTALVTGAARGIGRAVAEGLAAVGVNVALVDRRADDLTAVEKAIAGEGGKAVALATDLRCNDQIARAVERTVEAFERLDILVNCAGVSIGGPSEEYDEAAWDATFDVNVKAAFLAAQHAATYMIPQRSGVIINVASIGAVRSFPNNPAYQASKAAMRHLSRALANDWAQYNIRVNTLCPGYVKAPMTRASWSDPATHDRRAGRCLLNRWGEPEEFVGPVIFLASRASSYMTGNDLFIDGGFAATGILKGQ